MKLKVIFIKKIHIICFFIIIGALIFLYALFFPLNRTSSVVSIIDKTQFVQVDLTGDGYKDILYIKPENDNYYVQVRTQNESIQLSPNKKYSSLGKYYTHWSMRTNLKDITGDTIPEIFIQSCKNEKPIQALFIRQNGIFKNVMYNSNNILGVCNDSNINFFLTGNYSNNKINLNKHIFTNNKIESYKYTFSNNSFGIQTIITFIDCLENIKNITIDDYSKIFNHNIDEESLNMFKKFKMHNIAFYFQDSFFTNSNDKNNTLQWILNFKGVSTDNNITNYTFTLELKPNIDFLNNSYKINSLDLKNIN